jgi:spore coat protein U-like protein
LAILPLISAPALAGTASAQFAVTAIVLNTCAVTAGDLAFGNYSANSPSPVTASSALSITCTSGLSYTVALDGGTTTSAVTARAMSDGATPAAHTLNYGLYTSSAYTSIWGDGTSGTATMPGTGNGSAQGMTVYGRIPAAQYVTAGNYTDHVTVTVTY